MTYWSRFFRLMATGSVVLFMICIVLGAVLGTIIYRISLVSVIYGGFDGVFIKSHAKLFTSMTAALINLIIIMLLTKVLIGNEQFLVFVLLFVAFLFREIEYDKLNTRLIYLCTNQQLV
jgi:hypothetical protein